MNIKLLKITVAILLLTSPLLSLSQSKELISESERSVFKGALYSVWNRLRALNPRTQTKEATGNEVVATAGIRGAKGTETLFTPYWKGDKSNDKQFEAEIESILNAQTMADNGKLNEAENAYAAFIIEYPQSELLPNAQFAKALTQAAAGKKDIAINGMKLFIRQNSKHPLAKDAELVVLTLSKT